jgi:penicillin-binding protein 1A
MPYRPQKRNTPAGRPNGNGNGTRHRPSYAARLAVSRARARKPAAHGSGGTLLAVALILVVSVLGVVSVGAIAGGGAAAVTIASLEHGLPDVQEFRDLDFSQPSTIWDRNGPGKKNSVQLAQFWDERRKVVEFKDIPPIVLDVTTATEDDTFWDNPGFDFQATVNAFLSAAGGGSERGGGSTITQQLVRARLLPEDVVTGDNTTEGLYLRKAKELLQAYNLTQAFPGEEGKKAIITAYLNEISYGTASGIAAAAELYLGKQLSELTVSEAALLAAIPQSPLALYPWAKDPKTGRYTNIVKERGKKLKNGKHNVRFVVKTCPPDDAKCVDTPLVRRRDYVLSRLHDGKGHFTTLSDEQYQQALNEKIVIKPPKDIVYKAPAFVNALLPQLDKILADRKPLKSGGYTVITTLDWKAQQLGQNLIEGGAYIPNLPASKYYQAIRERGLGRDAGWIGNLRGSDLHNGALVAMDYRTGDILAYVGSAGYYRRATPAFAPKVDHVGGAWRQPGSAWKPIIYTTGLDTHRLTAGTLLLDKQETFGPGWTPSNASGTYQGYISVRDAIQQSLNIPAIRALQATGITTVRRYAIKAGYTFLPTYGNKALDVAGLAGALGTVEVRPLDMTAAFGAFGNGGKVTKPRYIEKVIDAHGNVIFDASKQKPDTTQVWSPQAAYIMANILEGNTNMAINPAWGAVFEMHNTTDGSRREAAVKTGTTNMLKDYSTYGILPMPKSKKQPALAVGVWYGNSDNTSPNLGLLHFSLDNAGRTWAAFVRDYMNNKPAPGFRRPPGIVNYGGEIYIAGTQPGGAAQVDSARPVTTEPDQSSSSGPGGRRGGGGNDGGPAPAPTCQPGFTNKPPGCTIPIN